MPAITELSARALLLDMDGTLVDSDAVVERCWRRWAAEHGLDGDAAMRVVHGRQGHLSMAILLPERPMERNIEENRLMLAEETADTDGVVPVPGAPAFLAALGGLPHALVTSASDALARVRMGAAGLPLPAVMITAESVGAGKPDPEGFLKGAAALGFAPADCLAFEDSEAGIAAALAAGMQVVGIGPRATEHNPTVQVNSLEEVRVTRNADGTLAVRVGG
ncbi:HAD-IA family hydrolase [Kitasatospora sp. NBC_00315]|uniref:HAD-IA family hydrolase n=1 Tax=Kitasatospora sp. NBC_00315 TaxID=2975963 RepID=UPI00324BA139